jgi:hypothetical protein
MITEEFYFKLDLIDAAKTLKEDDYNDLIVALFDEADSDSHVALMKQMYNIMFNIDKEEFKKYINK